jgi:iron complex outermembrane receptor protein
MNLGLICGFKKMKISLDAYQRNTKDIIQNSFAYGNSGISYRSNLAQISSKGVESTISFESISNKDVRYSSDIVVSYNTNTLHNSPNSALFGTAGSPGLNGTNMVRVFNNEKIGNIWGFEFEKVSQNGKPIFKDLNGDGYVTPPAPKDWLNSNTDFKILGNGLPKVELGWNHRLTFSKWHIDAFFRSALGHSLINLNRLFHEPRVSVMSYYNYVNTSKAVDGLKVSEFSSLYVEKADFIKLDNFSISRSIELNHKYLSDLTLSLVGNNFLLFTNYTGSDPEPSLIDSGTHDDVKVLVPGIDRRESYLDSSSLSLEVKVNF